jgi:ABC-type phosphate transport system substrate-binding protein
MYPHTASPRRSAPRVAALCAALALLSAPAAAQSATRPAAGVAAAKPATATPQLTGSYTGTATVPLGDSTIVVPVTYTFAPGANGTSGVAIVPGQGQGVISNVQRTGQRLRFRVTAAENRMLEHDGTVAADGSIEGMVNMDGLPVAKFRIAPAKTAPSPTAKPPVRQR